MDLCLCVRQALVNIRLLFSFTVGERVEASMMLKMSARSRDFWSFWSMIDMDLGRNNAGAFYLFSRELVAGEIEFGQLGAQGVDGDARVNERAEGHVAGYAGKTVEVSEGHSL